MFVAQSCVFVFASAVRLCMFELCVPVSMYVMCLSLRVGNVHTPCLQTCMCCFCMFTYVTGQHTDQCVSLCAVVLALVELVMSVALCCLCGVSVYDTMPPRVLEGLCGSL